MKEGLDWLARGIADAVRDIRHKVVEEPWFGRAVTADPGATEPMRDPMDGWRHGTPDNSAQAQPHDLPDHDSGHAHRHQR